MDPEKLNRNPWGRGRKKKEVRSEERRVGKELKYPLTDEWTKKMWYIHTMKYYLAIKNNEISPSAATWMELEYIMLQIM